MVRIGRILKDFRETGALNSLIALWGFVDDYTCVRRLARSYARNANHDSPVSETLTHVS
jgi:hypothetical protein